MYIYMYIHVCHLSSLLQSARDNLAPPIVPKLLIITWSEGIMRGQLIYRPRDLERVYMYWQGALVLVCKSLVQIVEGKRIKGRRPNGNR